MDIGNRFIVNSNYIITCDCAGSVYITGTAENYIGSFRSCHGFRNIGFKMKAGFCTVVCCGKADRKVLSLHTRCGSLADHVALSIKHNAHFKIEIAELCRIGRFDLFSRLSKRSCEFLIGHFCSVCKIRSIEPLN